MNWVDAVIVVVIIGYTVAGVLRGFVWELAIFCTLVFGIILGKILSYPLGMMIDAFVGNPPVSKTIGFFVGFLTVSIVFRVVASFAKAKIKQHKWEKADQRLGGVLGFFEAILLVMVVCTAVALYSRSWRGVHESFLGRKAVVAFCWILPSGMSARAFGYLEGATETIQGGIDRAKTTREDAEELSRREAERREAIRRARDGLPPEDGAAEGDAPDGGAREYDPERTPPGRTTPVRPPADPLDD